MEKQSIAKNLVYLRKTKGYSQEELAHKTQVTVRTIQRIEKGEVTPHLQTIKLLAVALEVEIEELLPLENPKEEAIQKKWLLLMHGLPLIGLVLPLFNILLPLFLWIHKREDNPIYNRHGRKIINFQISIFIFFILGFVALFLLPGAGFIIFMSVIPFAIITIIANIIYVLNKGKCFYPLAIPFIRKQKAHKTVIIAILICTFLFSCSPKKSYDYIERIDGSRITADSLNKKIDQLVADANIHGMAVTVFNENDIVYDTVVGYKNFREKQLLTDTTNMYGASYSKALFSVLVMKLVEEDVLDLDTPLESYLPQKIYEYEPLTRWHDDFSDLKVDTLYHKITARMCLNHTTGFSNYRWYEKDQKLRVHFEPGSRYSYSGEGFIYLQVVLEKMTGKSLEQLAQEKIFKPLQMTKSSYQWNPVFENDFAYGHTADGKLYKKDIDNEPRAGGTLETTIDDYSRFLVAVLQDKIISNASREEIFKSQIRIRSEMQFGPLSMKDTTLYDPINLSYGLGWGVFETPYGKGAFKEGHGDGFQHYSILFPESGKGIMIMTNTDNGESIYEELLEVAIANTYTPVKWQGWPNYKDK